MNNKVDGMCSKCVVFDEFKKIKKQGENKMTASSNKNETKMELSFQVGNSVWQNIGAGVVSWGITNKPKNPYWPTKVIVNNRTTIVFFENGNKRIVTCDTQDQMDIEKGVLLAIAHEIFGGKEKYRQMYSKKVDKKTYFFGKYKNKKVASSNSDDDIPF